MNQAMIKKAAINPDEIIQTQSPLIPVSALVEAIKTLDTPLVKKTFLTNLIGTATESFATYSEADQFISYLRDDWCY